MRIDELKMAYLDVETTGLSPAMGDRIVEIGIVVCRGERESERFSRLVNPGMPIPEDAQRIHGITDADVSDHPPFSAIVADVRSVLQGAWVVGHSVPFDAGFVAMEIALAGYQVKPLGCLDTCKLASVLWDLPNYQLNTVARSLGILIDRQHRALDDAQVARTILCCFSRNWRMRSFGLHLWVTPDGGAFHA